MGPLTDIPSTIETCQDRSPEDDESLPPGLDCVDKHATEHPKRYGHPWQTSSDNTWESVEDIHPTEGGGYLGPPDHMRESMSSFTGRPGIKGRNETIRMTLLCAIYFGVTFTWGVEMTCA